MYSRLFGAFWQSTYNIYGSLIAHDNYKIRIENKFIYPPFYMTTTNKAFYISKKQYLDLHLPFNIPSLMNEDLLFYVFTDIGSYPIVGSYLINNTLVLCSIPNAKTLADSYKNNKEDTKRKLQSMLKSSYDYADFILNEAKRVIT